MLRIVTSADKKYCNSYCSFSCNELSTCFAVWKYKTEFSNRH